MDVFLPAVREAWRLPAPESDGDPEVVASALSYPESYASALDHSGNDSGGDDPPGGAGCGLLGADQFLGLPQAVGVHAAPEEGFRATGSPRQPTLMSGDGTLGGWHLDDGNWRAGRFGEFRFGGSSVVPGIVAGAQWRQLQHPSPAVQLCPRRLGAGLATWLRDTEAALRSISVAARRAFAQPCTATTVARSDPKEGPVEAVETGDDVRKGRASEWLRRR